MRWTAEARAELARQYTRIGYKTGELWPVVRLKPTDLLFVLRSVPDGAGLTGFKEALHRLPKRAWYRRWC